MRIITRVISKSISLSLNFFKQVLASAYIRDTKSLNKAGLIAVDVYGMVFAEVCEVHWLLPVHIVLLRN